MTLTERLEKLPPMCASRLASTGEVILIERGSSGYYHGQGDMDPDEFNLAAGITPAQVQAMEVGSMFGWDVPGADPDHESYAKLTDFSYHKRVR